MNKQEVRSVPTTTIATNDNMEYLFLRLKKRNKFVRINYLLCRPKGNLKWSIEKEKH